MRNALFAATMAALTTGCGGSEEIWVFYISPAADPVSEQAIAHNFNGAQPYAGQTTTGDWTNTMTTTGSDTIQFAQIVKVKGADDAFLIMGGMAIPGQKAGGVFTFSWDDASQETDREQHTTGYFNEDFTSTTSTTTISMDLSGGTAAGTASSQRVQVQRFTESDTWDTNSTGTSSQISPSNYLEYPDGGFVSNDPTLADCSGDCFYEVTNTTSTTNAFTAEKTKYSDEDVMNTVGGATNPS
ncbi:MAG: hypothetical protein KC912_13185 [Proteobacteria bacterium]|nr:hypothetical protein [Pseudomonadota bacterium]